MNSGYGPIVPNPVDLESAPRAAETQPDRMKPPALPAAVLLLLAGCSADRHPIHVSPSGDYGIYATVNGPSDTLVTLHLVDASGKELYATSTGVSDAMKWAEGWMPKDDVVVLWSSDIGTSAYVVDAAVLVRLSEISDEIRIRARELYESKYGVEPTD